MDASSFEAICQKPMQEKLNEWEYMRGTIRSSWEFVDYIFLIEGVSRAFTHQLVRHRIGTSFAQQSQRTVDMSEFKFITPDAIKYDMLAKSEYEEVMKDINDAYETLLLAKVKPEDARGILPTNVSTNIIFKANLRTLSQMCGERLCVKAQGEFRDVMKLIRDRVCEQHPWAEPVLRVHCAQTGVCCFPHYSHCQIKDQIFDPATGGVYGKDSIRPMTTEEIQKAWEMMEYGEDPTDYKGMGWVGKDGRP
jgi:flavin-dependent thymidylate synthase